MEPIPVLGFESFARHSRDSASKRGLPLTWLHDLGLRFSPSDSRSAHIHFLFHISNPGGTHGRLVLVPTSKAKIDTWSKGISESRGDARYVPTSKAKIDTQSKGISVRTSSNGAAIIRLHGSSTSRCIGTPLYILVHPHPIRKCSAISNFLRRKTVSQYGARTLSTTVSTSFKQLTGLRKNNQSAEQIRIKGGRGKRVQGVHASKGGVSLRPMKSMI